MRPGCHTCPAHPQHFMHIIKDEHASSMTGQSFMHDEGKADVAEHDMCCLKWVFASLPRPSKKLWEGSGHGLTFGLLHAGG